MARTCRYTVGIWIVFASCTDQVHLKKKRQLLMLSSTFFKIIRKKTTTYNVENGVMVCVIIHVHASLFAECDNVTCSLVVIFVL